MELFVERDYNRNVIKFYLKEGAPGFDIFLSLSPEGAIKRTELDHSAVDGSIQPLITLPMRLAEQFIIEVANYATGQGIAKENENHLKGKLEATEKHLTS